MPPPNPAQLKVQQAVALLQGGRLSDARRLLADVRRMQNSLFEGWFYGGVEAFQAKRYQEAVSLLRQAVRINPKHAAANIHLAAALVGEGQAKEAVALLESMKSPLGRSTDYWTVLGDGYVQLSNKEAAIEAAREVTKLQPKNAAAHEILGERTVAAQGVLEGEQHFQRAVQLDPKLACGWTNLGVVRAEQCRLKEALECFDKAKILDPRWRFAYTGRALALLRAYRMGEAAQEYERWLSIQPDDFEAASARLMTLNYLEDRAPEALAEAHRAFGQRFPDCAKPPFHSHAKLRVGLLSPDLRSHSCAWFIEPLLMHADREKTDYFLYHAHATVDATSDRLRQLAHTWRHVAGQSSENIVAQIRSDEIDVLVDLAGHSSFNLLEVFARRAAPVQVTYLGYPNTTGLRQMDFRLVDGVTDPENQADAWHTETLVRFAPTAWAYLPPGRAPACTAPPCLSGHTVTFGSFNNATKITLECLHAWARLLQSVPGSVLLLKSRGLQTPEVRAEMRLRLLEAGIPEDRQVLLEHVHDEAEHLALYGKIDVALDTYPYNGTTTTCEALWMGVPVVTLCGRRHASRVGASLLNAVGHSEWAARNWEDYERVARELATSGSGLAEIRARLRDDMARSPLLDHRGQAQRFGEALRTCWNRCASRKDDAGV